MMRRALLAGVCTAAVASAAAGKLGVPVLRVAREDRASRFDPDDPQALDKAVRYSRERERLWLIGTLSDLALGGASVASGAPAALARFLDSRVRRRWARTPAFILLWSAGNWLLELPLAYYAGYVVEHRYGLSNQTRRGWFAEHLKGLAVGGVLNTLLLTGFYKLVRSYPRRWWLATSALSLPFTLLLAGLYPVLIAPLFNKYEPVGDAELEERVRAMSEREGVCVSQVLRMDMSRQTSKANAFFAGVGRTKRIVLADTLLEGFSPDEVAVVVAHELGHQVHRDTWKLAALSGVATFGGAYALHRLFPVVVRRATSRTGAAPLGDVATLPLVDLVTSVFGLLGMPLANAFVRRLERGADTYAVRLTMNPRAFIGAMRRLQRTNLADPDPPALVRLLLHSHPSLGERIRWAETQLRAG
jgi:STE24 endopeptidase